MLGEVALRQIDPVEGETGLDGELGKHFDAGLLKAHGGSVAAKEAAPFYRHFARVRPLGTEAVLQLHVAESVSSQRDGHVRSDGESLRQVLVGVGKVRAEGITVLQFDFEMAQSLPGLDEP